MKINKLSKKGGLIAKTNMQALIIEGFNEEAILKCCNGEAKTHKGHQFKFPEEKVDAPEPEKAPVVEEKLDEVPFGEGKAEQLAKEYIPFIYEDNSFIKSEEAALFIQDNTGRKPGPEKLRVFMLTVLKELRKEEAGE